MQRQQVWYRQTVMWLGLLTLGIGSVGCLRTIPKVTSPVALPKRFTKMGQVALSARWWKDLRDENLNKLVETGLQQNLDLRAAAARLKQRMALARRAGAGRFPTLTGKGDGSIGANRFGLSSQLFIGLIASYELDVWGRIRSAHAAARLDVLASRESARAAAISLSGEMAATWYNLIERRGQVRLLGQQMQTNEQSLSLLEARLRLGLSSAADILQQRQLVESQRGEQTWVKAEARSLEHQLAVLLGKSPKDFRAPQVTAFGALPPLPQTGIPAVLVRRRPDLRNAYLPVLAAHRRVGEAIADQFPRLTLTANANASLNVNSGVFGNWLTNLVAGILGPIFDGGARRAEVARTRAVAEEALQQYGTAILKALQEVENALVRERGRQQQLASQTKQLALAEKVIQQIRFRYQNGAENFLRVLDAVRSYQTLQRSLLVTQREVWLQRVALCRALAGSWTSPTKKATKTP